jgi:SHS2 domain-containing protein
MTEPRYKIEIIEDHASADFVFDAYGRTPADLFEACAKATFGVMTELNRIDICIERIIELTADDINELLYAFISELIYLKDAEKIFFREFVIQISDDSKSLTAIVKGERIDHGRHIIKTDVKAATYHDLNITHDSVYYRTRMILDL